MGWGAGSWVGVVCGWLATALGVEEISTAARLNSTCAQSEQTASKANNLHLYPRDALQPLTSLRCLLVTAVYKLFYMFKLYKAIIKYNTKLAVSSLTMPMLDVGKSHT
jgi:hypothetical protein